jgi:hypothetical protein
MSDPIENANNLGNIRVDIPFEDQAAIKRFLDLPYREVVLEADELVSKELLGRLIQVLRQAIQQKLNTIRPKRVLGDLQIGYQVLRIPEVELEVLPGELVEIRWSDPLDANTSPVTLSSSFVSDVKFTKLLVRRIAEEVYRKIEPSKLQRKAIHPILKGYTSLYRQNGFAINGGPGNVFETSPCGCYGGSNDVKTTVEGGYCDKRCY